MEHSQFFQQMLNFNKATFDNTFDAMVKFQDLAENTANSMLSQSPLFPEESKKAFNEWSKAYKKGREDFKKIVDENFKRAENFFGAAK